MTASASGRPIRFFTLVMIGWVAIRMLSQPGLFPSSLAEPPHRPGVAPDKHAAPMAIASIQPTAPMAQTTPPTDARREVSQRPTPTNTTPSEAGHQGISVNLLAFITPVADFASRRHDSTEGTEGEANMFPSPIPGPPPLPVGQPSTDRWRGSAWTLWRPDSGSNAQIAAAGLLGGSQSGLRIDYDLTSAARRRAALYARMTRALRTPAAPEAAIGIAIQPDRAIPVSVAAERRIALGTGGRSAMAVMLVGGFGAVPVASGLETEGYVQSGLVGLRQRDAFIDGKLSLLAPVTGTALRIGAALSGGGQPSIERIDFGPEVQVRLPMPMAAARLSIEWRERIVGRAAPPSGLALTLATDF